MAGPPPQCDFPHPTSSYKMAGIGSYPPLHAVGHLPAHYCPSPSALKGSENGHPPKPFRYQSPLQGPPPSCRKEEGNGGGKRLPTELASGAAGWSSGTVPALKMFEDFPHSLGVDQLVIPPCTNNTQCVQLREKSPNTMLTNKLEPSLVGESTGQYLPKLHSGGDGEPCPQQLFHGCHSRQVHLATQCGAQDTGHTHSNPSPRTGEYLRRSAGLQKPLGYIHLNSPGHHICQPGEGEDT